jgi:hypothetical protein
MREKKVREIGDERRKWEKKRKKCADHVREKGETKLMRELVSIFTHQNFWLK